MHHARALTALPMIALLAALAGLSAPRPTPPALVEAVEVIKGAALGADRLDWDRLVSEIESRLGPDATADAYRLAAVEAYADPHASYLSAEQVRSWQGGTASQEEAEAEPPSEAADRGEQADRPTIPTAPWGELLPGGVGYLGLPPCITGDPEQLQAYARGLRSQVASLDARGATRWIVDLRLDGGGNVWPMLAGLAPLLGDGPVAASIGRSPEGEATVTTTGVGGAGAWLEVGGERTSQFSMAWEGPMVGPAQARAPIAVLLGAWTMSSGELVAVAMASRHATRSFGEPTAGLTTATDYFPLADGGCLVLPVSRMATVGGPAITGPIRPDVLVPFGDWPRIDDEPVRAALAWLAEEAARPQVGD